MIRLSFLILFTLGLLFSGLSLSASCDPTQASSAQGFLKDCSVDSTDVAVIKDVVGTSGVRELVIDVAKKVLGFGALFAVGAIVFSGIRYTTSAGEDEKLKSAKNIAVYAIIGLLLILMAFPLVDILIGFIYDLGK